LVPFHGFLMEARSPLLCVRGCGQNEGTPKEVAAMLQAQWSEDEPVFAIASVGCGAVHKKMMVAFMLPERLSVSVNTKVREHRKAIMEMLGWNGSGRDIDASVEFKTKEDITETAIDDLFPVTSGKFRGENRYSTGGSAGSKPHADVSRIAGLDLDDPDLSPHLKEALIKFGEATLVLRDAGAPLGQVEKHLHMKWKEMPSPRLCPNMPTGPVGPLVPSQPAQVIELVHAVDDLKWAVFSFTPPTKIF